MLELTSAIQQSTTDFGIIWAAIITAIGVVIGGIILIIVKRVRPIVGVKDMWEQINTQNDQISKQNDKIVGQNSTIVELQKAVNTLQQEAFTFRQTQLGINRNLGEGFDALYGYVLRTTTSGTTPDFTPDESRKVNSARALREAQVNQPEMYI